MFLPVMLAVAAVVSASAPIEEGRTERNLKVFDAAWDTLTRHYYDPSFGGRDMAALRIQYRPRAAAAPNEMALYINVMGNMLRQLDVSHVAVMPPPSKRAPNLSQRPDPSDPCLRSTFRVNPGVHMGRSWVPQTLGVVSDVEKGSGAEKAGVEPGWTVRSMNMKFGVCGAQHLRLEVIDHPGAPPRMVEYDERPRLPESSHEARTLASGARLLRFDNFQKDDVAWVLAELKLAPAAGLILDLRSNGGGRADLVGDVTGALIGPDHAIGVHVRAKHRWRLRSRARAGTIYAGPLAVLVGPMTASAAEIVADSLRREGRAVVVGERTSGRVLASRLFALPDGGKIQVPIADYRTSAGGRLEDVGVEPDIRVWQTLTAIRADRDLVVEAAERAILAGRAARQQP